MGENEGPRELKFDTATKLVFLVLLFVSALLHCPMSQDTRPRTLYIRLLSREQHFQQSIPTHKHVLIGGTPLPVRRYEYA